MSLARKLWACCPIVLLIACWHGVLVIGLADPDSLPGPAAVARAMLDLGGHTAFFNDLGATILRSLGGLALGVLLGVPIGAAMALSPVADGFFGPIIKASYALPKTALVPLLILWFGIGSMTDIAAVMLSTVLPMIIYTYHGIQDTPKMLVWSAAAMGTGSRAMTWRVLLPSASAAIFAGLRIALGFSWVIAISAEMIASNTGIGKLIFIYGQNGAYDYMFAGVATIVLVALLCDAALLQAANRLLRWQGPVTASALP